MTKDWNIVQDEIKELSFNQKRPLEEVKMLMEKKHRFRASTRAYRMKLKEWGLMRRKSRIWRSDHSQDDTPQPELEDNSPRPSSLTTQSMNIGHDSLKLLVNTGGSESANDDQITALESGSFGLLNQATKYVSETEIYEFTRTNQANPGPEIDIPSWMKDPPLVPDSLMEMLGYVLDNDCQKLEKLLMKNRDKVNTSVGLPFGTSSLFCRHPALADMNILQHSHQTLLDIACGMPNGPVVWILLSYDAKGSAHPLGVDLALYNAIKNERHYTVQALLMPDRSDANGLPDKLFKPLLQAVLWSGPEIVSTLLKRGARVDEAGLSPTSVGLWTALQLCLERRNREYHNEIVREKCNEMAKLLLNAGANVNIPPPEGSSHTPLQMLIEPWQNRDHWSMRMSSTELYCLGKFVEQSADLRVGFLGSPCASRSGNTFIHQVIWHAKPCVSRQVIDSFSMASPAGGAVMLHELLDACPDSMRNLTETLQDVDILLERGLDPDVYDDAGKTPLRKCIEHTPTADIAALAQKLLDGGADPEREAIDGSQVYASAVRTLKEPLRTEILYAMISKMDGCHTTVREGEAYKWREGIFPIPDFPTLQQIEACSKADSDFGLSMQEMVPFDVQACFQRAYIAVLTSRFFENITRSVLSNKVSEKDRWALMLALAMRRKAGLKDYHFGQILVVALLDFPGIRATDLTSETEPTIPGTVDTLPDIVTHHQSHSTTPAVTPPVYAPFQLNTKDSASTRRPPLTSRPSHNSDTSNDAFIGDTTRIRWHNPEAGRMTGDTVTAAACVAQYRCSACVDDRLLTETELRKHDIEHSHTADCDRPTCLRRFCKEKKKVERSRDRTF